MLKWSDMSNTIPDEKVVVTYLLYLCARLLDIRHESRAARVIQLAWRKYRLGKMEKELQVCLGLFLDFCSLSFTFKMCFPHSLTKATYLP